MKKISGKYLVILVYITLFVIGNINAQDNIKKSKDAVSKGDYVTAVNILKDVVKTDKGYEANYLYGLALFNTG